jgi:hypothetical protein
MRTLITIIEESGWLVLNTPFGPAGARLQRGVELPINTFRFPNTPEGRISADRAQAHLQDYVDRYVVLKSSRQ